MRYIALIILLISFKLEGQYQFDFEIDSSGGIECFRGGTWRQVPEQRWSCDTLNPIEGNFSLHHSFDNPQEDCDYLVLWCDQLNTSDPFSFSFRIRHGFAPSSMNNWQLVLGAHLFEDPGASGGGAPYVLNGIVIGVNYTGTDDHIKMWGVRYGLSEILCSTPLNYQEQVGTDRAPLFRVQGDGEGNLELYWSPDPAQQALAFLGSCRIGEMDWGRQLLLRYRYTSSRDRALWLDKLVLEGHYDKDTIAPVVSAVELLDGHSLQLGFSEKVMLDEACKFVLYSEERPGGVYPDSLRKMEDGVIISFPEVFPNRVSHQLRVEGVVDLDGNLLLDTLVHVMRNEAQWGDLVFNEVMADPDPAVRLKEEYLELKNRSEYLLNLEEWRLKVNDRSYLLDASNVENKVIEVLPGEFILLKGITLPNDGAILSLNDKEGTLIHAASYTIPWDGPDWKKEGGWSLESPDAEQVCRVSASWDYSMDPEGGTPGRINSNESILTDKDAPVLLYAGEGDPGELRLHYIEPIRLPHDAKAAFSLDPGGAVPDSARLLDPLQETLQLYFSGDFQDWPFYRLTLSGLKDCAGNRSDDQVVLAGAVSQPAFASVLINEIMYDPEEGKPEYVELFLPGDKILDLQDLAIHLVEEGGSADHPIVLASHSRLFLPGQFLVLTNCVPQLEETYGLEVSGQWVEVAGLSGLKNSSGTIYLTDRAGQVVDMAVYKDEMHMELLDDPRGISLERISAKRPGSDPDNWHSAASISGYATPGRENSQSPGVSESDLLLDVLPEVFSPDNDGYEDLLKITINSGGNDWVIGLLITDLQGTRIKVLANNHLAGPTVCYTWDGEGENGSMQAMGFYVIHARGYRPATGEQWIRRKAVGLVYR